MRPLVQKKTWDQKQREWWSGVSKCGLTVQGLQLPGNGPGWGQLLTSQLHPVGNAGCYGESVLHESHPMSPRPQLVIYWWETNTDTFLSKKAAKLKHQLDSFYFPGK